MGMGGHAVAHVRTHPLASLILISRIARWLPLVYLEEMRVLQ
jgi:hypothetical protein